MPIDPAKDTLLHINQILKMFPGPDGKPKSKETVVGWIIRGLKVAGTDARVRLEGVRVGAAWYTTAEAIRAFAEQLTTGEAMPKGWRSEAERKRASNEAADRLEAMGLKPQRAK